MPQWVIFFSIYSENVLEILDQQKQQIAEEDFAMQTLSSIRNV
jgi:hypothetical protein